MNENIDRGKAGYVMGLFSRISPDYDFMNRLMTFGMDRSWRRFLMSLAHVPSGGRLLDVGTGTGDIALEALNMDRTMRVAGLDFTREMMEAGRRREGVLTVNWCRGDALCLPFRDRTFDAVVSGFLIRNVTDVRSALTEQTRVVRPGGRVVCLDTTPAPEDILRPFVGLYIKYIIPMLGKILTGKGDAYRYLATSTMNFLKPEVLAGMMRDAGLADVNFRRFMFGNIAVHWGVRPVPSDGAEGKTT